MKQSFSSTTVCQFDYPIINFGRLRSVQRLCQIDRLDLLTSPLDLQSYVPASGCNDRHARINQAASSLSTSGFDLHPVTCATIVAMTLLATRLCSSNHGWWLSSLPLLTPNFSLLYIFRMRQYTPTWTNKSINVNYTSQFFEVIWS